MKSLLIAAGTGANNIIVNIGDEYEDRVDYILIDELESDVWKIEFSAERIFDIVVTRQPVILLATLGGKTGIDQLRGLRNCLSLLRFFFLRYLLFHSNLNGIVEMLLYLLPIG